MFIPLFLHNNNSLKRLYKANNQYDYTDFFKQDFCCLKLTCYKVKTPNGKTKGFIFTF